MNGEDASDPATDPSAVAHGVTPNVDANAGDGRRGLTSQEAQLRLAHDGPNALPEIRAHPLRRLLATVTGPVPLLLEAAVVLEIVAGHSAEAIIIALLIVFNAVLGVAQEGRAHDALAALRQRLAVSARVRRDDQWRVVDATTLVVGDLVHVRAGDIVPADLLVREGSTTVDQSVLTGESAEVDVGVDASLYAGAVVRRGEATGEVSATGARTFFGTTAQLTRTATTVSHLETTIFRIVWALLAMDGALVVAVLVYGWMHHLSWTELVPFVLILVVATVPVALPATFTLTTSLGALELARHGVLVTRLSAIEEAAAMDLLCTDKTGTITQNRLRVADVLGYGVTRDDVLALAAAASERATQDPLDVAILDALGDVAPLERLTFTPFDPSSKRSEATVRQDGVVRRVAKGTPRVLAALGNAPTTLEADVERLAGDGARILAVARGDDASLAVIGLVAMGDPLRPDSAPLIEHLGELGVRIIMVTGDTEATALAVAREVGVGSRVVTPDELRVPADGPLDFDVVAGVLPEDKLRLIERAQRAGHVVGMTGDGVNDAPALKRAEMGVAVASATDVAKEAASVVLTTEGLTGVVTAIETGRRVYQRMLTYTLNKIVKTFQVALFLSLGLLLTGQFVTTPRMVLLLLFANDFVTMSISTDHVGFSAQPDRWRVSQLAWAALSIALAWLAVSFATYYVARDVLGYSLALTQTLVFVMLVATGQATVYLVRDAHHLWRARPSRLMLGATATDLVVVSVLANRGWLMAPASASAIGVVLGSVLVVTFLLDLLKAPLSRRIRSTTDDEADGRAPGGQVAPR
ncbi:MAG: HAD-IC family P-type ATPase [Acidimicrobiales bacterium]